MADAACPAKLRLGLDKRYVVTCIREHDELLGFHRASTSGYDREGRLVQVSLTWAEIPDRT